MGSLHIDYRPQSFEEVIGNKGVISSLKSILSREKENIPHAMLFSGQSGCGKTTLARIVAEKLGCPEKINDEPNGDFIEINASNNRGIDTARSIMQTMHYHPAISECRVWLLDEVHQATKDFQNSLLKALEDSPEHTYFLLCTTEPEKLLKTILNRCSTFEVENVNDKGLYQLLNWVSTEEDVGIPDDVKDEIVEVSDGCPRQALVTLDQVIDLPEEEMLGAVKNAKVEEKDVRELCQAMLKGSSWKKASSILKKLKGTDPEKFRRAILGYMSAVLLNGGDPQAALIIDLFKEPSFYSGMPGIVLATYQSLE